MIDDVLAQGHQVGDALWRVDAANIPGAARAGGLVVCGMGGSAVGADLARAAIGGRATAPISTVRGYAVEPWTGADTLVLCASYSGETEETLAAFESAGAAGATRVVLTTGGRLAELAREADVPVIGVPSGMQPRAAVVYMTVAVLECAKYAGAAPDLRAEIEAAGALLGTLADEWREGGEPAELAAAVGPGMPVVHGAGATAAVARRWKTQFNENSKRAAVASELSEANHNEIEGWAWAREHVPVTGVFLAAPGTDSRLERRLELTAEFLADAGVTVVKAAARGETPVEHVLSLVQLGDLLSVRLAELDGTDPDSVDAIEGFKRRLA